MANIFFRLKHFVRNICKIFVWFIILFDYYECGPVHYVIAKYDVTLTEFCHISLTFLKIWSFHQRTAKTYSIVFCHGIEISANILTIIFFGISKNWTLLIDKFIFQISHLYKKKKKDIVMKSFKVYYRWILCPVCPSKQSISFSENSRPSSYSWHPWHAKGTGPKIFRLIKICDDFEIFIISVQWNLSSSTSV